MDEGFLDGLDLDFTPGLNVLIGPRGSGKTSIIELIRFALGAEAVTDRFERAAREHALSILGSGRVTVSLGAESDDIEAVRTQSDPEPRITGEFETPLVFSQNEIEAVGLEAQGRLRIIDGFLTSQEKADPERLSLLKSRIRSLTAEISDLAEQIDSDEERTAQLVDVKKQLKEATEERQAILESVSASDQDQERLSDLASRAAEAAVRSELISETHSNLRAWKKHLDELITRGPALPQWPEAAGEPDLLDNVRTRVSQLLEDLGSELESFDVALHELRKLQVEIRDRRTELENQARELRQKLDALQKGAGQAAQQVSVLREKLSQLEALKSKVGEMRDRRIGLQENRGELLDELEVIQRRRFEARKSAAQDLNSELGPAIKVEVERGGMDSAYANAIREGLRGSGLHYNTLAPVVADRMSPRELVEAIESGDAELLANVLDITQDRAVRILAELRTADLGKLLTIPVQDTVHMFLLDGKEYKPTPELSTGQRCTVILSILLAQEGPSLIVDQPEDHLDNAFVVETLIEAIQKSKGERQLIFSTHNPNIPVLGYADMVAVLGSDGSRGFVRHASPVDSSESVESITTIMEGGAEAFARRAAFYGSSIPALNE